MWLRQYVERRGYTIITHCFIDIKGVNYVDNTSEIGNVQIYGRRNMTFKKSREGARCRIVKFTC